MEPLIKVGDIINIEKISADELKKFDVIVFRNCNKLMCHYFWSWNPMNESQFITRSLLNPTENDPPTDIDNLVGKVLDYEITQLMKIKIILRNLFS
jgi:signal peptidase I